MATNTAHPPLTLSQQRAADAWRCTLACAEGTRRQYATLAKGVPALILSSGLLQTLAYLEATGAKPRHAHRHALGGHLRAWLQKRFPERLPAPETDRFKPFMEALMALDGRTLQRVTREALDWLRWLRQVAPALADEAADEAADGPAEGNRS